MAQEDEDFEELNTEDLPEGFDVFDYDSRRARAGQFLVLAVFILAAILFLFAFYTSIRNGEHEPGNRRSKSFSRLVDSPAIRNRIQ